MSFHPEHAVTLTCHPETPCCVLSGIRVLVRRTPEGILLVRYVLEGDLGRLRIPASRPARIAQQLWQHTCCEILVARDDLPAYHEFNLSPSGEWAGYAFRRYREGMAPAEEPDADALNPRIAVRGGAEHLELDASIRLDRLSPACRAASLRVALCVVIEEKAGPLSYWAIRHPVGKPDFHHAQTFALELAPPALSPQNLGDLPHEFRH